MFMSQNPPQIIMGKFLLLGIDLFTNLIVRNVFVYICMPFYGIIFSDSSSYSFESKFYLLMPILTAMAATTCLLPNVLSK